jgi:Family of unknown function (DUF6101)
MSNVVYISNTRACAAPDSRADSGIRKIFVDQRCIRIERVVAGVKMRLAVPVESYRGVVLSCDDRYEPRLYTVTLAHRDAEFSVVLHNATEWTDILSIWQRWARFFARPTIFNEETTAPSEKPRHSGMPARQRRRSATLAKRRPGILTRRRQGRVGPSVNLLAGARELISYE